MESLKRLFWVKVLAMSGQTEPRAEIGARRTSAETEPVIYTGNNGLGIGLRHRQKI